MSDLAKKVFSWAVLSTALGFFASCGGGGSSTTAKAGAPGSGGAFLVKESEPPNNGSVFLNQPITVKFTQEVDLTTVNLNSWSFTVYDSRSGRPVGEPVIGKFYYAPAFNGGVDKKVIQFLPAFPTNDTFDNGGFRPGRRYDVHLNGADSKLTPVIRSVFGQILQRGFTFSFTTPNGTSPEELFYDVLPGGPKKVSLSPENTVEKLNFFLGGNLKAVTLVFNQPLNPSSLSFNQNHIYLRYKDPDLNLAGWTKVPTILTLAENLPKKAVVTLTPIGVLPSNAEIQAVVEPELEDIAGENNLGDPAFHRIFGSFKTEPATSFQYDAIVEDFRSTELFDMDAPHMEPLAEWGKGRLRASFNFGGSITLFDFEPHDKELILNTDFTQVVPKQGIPYTVSGGVFEFRNILIPEGVQVRGQGTNPLVFLATGSVEVRGAISVDGGNGDRVDTLSSANFSTPGGISVCQGGKGGQGSPVTVTSSKKGGDGYGPNNRPSGGGKGGHSAYGNSTRSCFGAGGGGGSYTTQGDPKYLSTSFTQMTGKGGDGGMYDALLGPSFTPKGGAPGAVAWSDKDPDNNFYGRDIQVRNGRDTIVIGELKAPLGGQGGGGGGDRIPSSSVPNPGFPSDNKGGGGGAGGGVLIIKAIGPILVTKTGRISADGGNGGGGEASGSCNQGGGGAGGSGGTVILMSAQKIQVEPKDSSEIDNGHFPVSADGGVGTTGTFGGGGGFASKYPRRNAGRPNRGGFGGMGLVELFAPDPVNNIVIPKGQIRPEPIRLPSTFGFLSRARSRWIYTGATVRQAKNAAWPRYLDPALAGGKRGPEYRFAGVHKSGVQAGYVDYRSSVTAPGKATGWFYFPRILSGTILKALPAGNGSSFHVLEAAKGGLGATNSLKGARLQAVQGGANILGEWLILGNTDKKIYLDPKGGAAFSPSLAGNQFRVVAKYFDIWTAGAKGFPLRVNGKESSPRVNVRFGFAACAGFDKDGNPIARYPAKGFAYDLETPSEREKFWSDGKGGYLGRPYVMFDILFNLSYNPQDPTNPMSFGELTPTTPRPEVRSLVLPFRF